jgi:hypothetical protein
MTHEKRKARSIKKVRTPRSSSVARIPEDLAAAIKQCWPRRVVEEFSVDESYFDEIRDISNGISAISPAPHWFGRPKGRVTPVGMSGANASALARSHQGMMTTPRNHRCKTSDGSHITSSSCRPTAKNSALKLRPLGTIRKMGPRPLFVARANMASARDLACRTLCGYQRVQLFVV